LCRSCFRRTRWNVALAENLSPPVVGDLTIAYEGLEMAAEPGLTLTIYAAGNMAVRGRIREALQASCQ
jgi:hypothetical protein